MDISIVIPTLNEGLHLEKTLEHLKELAPGPFEIIVVDGGSTDNTIEIAQRHQVKICHAKHRGRAAQMHEGALVARGDALCFLHADTLPRPDLIALIHRTLSKRSVAMGGFVSLMSGEKNRYWFSFLNYIKTYLCPMFYRPMLFFGKGLKLLFGDQVIFCRRLDYLYTGGFDTSIEVMEEADFCLKMNKLGTIKMVHRLVYSSDRRVAEWGFWKANRIYFHIAFGWAFGVPNDKLARLYTQIR